VQKKIHSKGDISRFKKNKNETGLFLIKTGCRSPVLTTHFSWQFLMKKETIRKNSPGKNIVSLQTLHRISKDTA
jgi:hypothetical protein